MSVAEVIKLFPKEHNKFVHQLMGMAVQTEVFVSILENQILKENDFVNKQCILFLQDKFTKNLFDLEEIIESFIKGEQCQERS